MLIRPLLVGLREVRSFLADPGALGFAFALPLVLIALMLAAFGGTVTFSGTAYIVDNDGGPYARALVDGLEAIDGLTVEMLDADDAESRINRSSILMYTEIPAGFSAAIDAGEPVELHQFQRGGGGQEGQIISSMTRGVLEELTLERDLRATAEGVLAELEVDPDQELFDAEVDRALGELRTSPAVGVETVRPGEDQPADLSASLFPRISAWMVLFSITIGAQSFILERRSGTLERLLTTRLTLNELFIGKWIAYFLRGALQFVLLFVVAGIVFDFFTVTSWINAVLFGVVITAAVASLGLVVATLAKTENQATWGAVFFTMAMALFGGSFFEGGQNLFGPISYVTITYWINTGFDRLLIDGEGLSSVGLHAAIMLAVTIAGLVVSRFFFKPLPEGAHG